MTHSKDRADDRRRRREEQIVLALRRNGTLRPPRRLRAVRGAQLLLAACLLVGVWSAGYSAGAGRRREATVSGAGLVQARGQAYVQSVSQLADVVGDDSLTYEQARDAAISAMLAAAYALTRARPSDSLASRLTSEIQRVRSVAAPAWARQ